MRIVYLDIDSLRPDHLGCYGYPRSTSPNIDGIAERGVRFTQAFCASSPCVPSRASFVSGRFAINHGALTHWGPGGRFYYPESAGHSRRYPFFPRYIREAGYKTVTFSSFGDRHVAPWFFSGWNEAHTFTLQGGRENADEVNAHVIPWIREFGAEEDYFLHVQYWDPHGFYTYPDEYMEQFIGQEAPQFPSEEEIQAQRTLCHPRSPEFFHWSLDWPIPDKMPLRLRNRSDVVQLINGYDGGVFYMDKHVGDILNAFRELGVEEEVCFVITADHGESFGEQGIYMEHGMASESTHHVPLIMTFPGRAKANAVCDQFVYNVDVMATLADLIGLPRPPGWDGLSFSQALPAPETAGVRDHLVLEHGLYACQRAVRDRRHYFLRTYNPGLYEFDPVVLYDLERDPHQTANVAPENPDVVRLMDHRLAQWLADNARRHGEIVDPMQEILRTGPFRYLGPREWEQRLSGAGWSGQAQRIRERYPEHFTPVRI
ncbi:MAG: sulfatase family protein [Bacilli bacterium]